MDHLSIYKTKVHAVELSATFDLTDVDGLFAIEHDGSSLVYPSAAFIGYPVRLVSTFYMVGADRFRFRRASFSSVIAVPCIGFIKPGAFKNYAC